MADKKISQLSAATTPLAGTEVLPIVQNSTTVKVPVSALTTGRTVSVLNLNSTNDSTINGMRVGVGGGNNTTNTAVGYQALNATATGGYCVSIGYFANRKVTSGIYNTAVGFDCGSNITTGQCNTSIGGGAGSNLTTGSNNAFWGYNAQPSSATVSNEYTYGDANVTAHRFVGGNLVIGTSGKGIDFSATASGSGTMTSELLADYEEGTFTPTMSSTGTAPTYNNAVCNGYYTKIGRVVYFGIGFTSFSGLTNSPTGDAIITGLPFTRGTLPTRTGAGGHVVYASSGSGNDTSCVFNVTGTQVNLLKMSALNKNTTALASTDTGGTNYELYVVGWYIV